MDTADTSNLKGTFVPIAQVTTVSPTLFTHTITLAAGFHAIKYTGPAEIRNFLFSVQTDSYTCPFPSTNTDLHFTFPGCNPQGTNKGNGAVFPCISVNNGTCATCYHGYALVGTSCVYNPCNND